jgi:hypothetical protein
LMTDGHCQRNSANQNDYGATGKRIRHTLTLVQSTATEKGGIVIYKEMDAVLSRLCTPTRRVVPHPTNPPAIFWRINASDSELFMAWFDDDNIHTIPRRLLENLSLVQAEALFLGLLEGDGGWDKIAEKYVKFCPGHSTALADGFQELALKLGYSATRTVQKAGAKNGKPTKEQWLVRLSTRLAHSIQKRVYSTEAYSGTVWDVTVPTGAFVARRNGKAFVTGNCQVFRCYADLLIQVAEYVDDRVETHHCAWVLAYLAGAYRNCLVNLEINGPGGAVMREFDNVKMLMRTELYARKVQDLDWEDFLDMARWYIYNRPDSMGRGFMLNFETQWKSKTVLMNQYRDLFTSDVLFIRSKPLLLEMANVTQDKDDIAPKAGGRLKDDRVLAASLAAKAYIDWIRGPLIQEGATYDIITAAEQGELSVTQQMVKRIVFDFWRGQEERAQAPETPTWLHDRGFI